jgi:hypothetical protein
VLFFYVAGARGTILQRFFACGGTKISYKCRADHKRDPLPLLLKKKLYPVIHHFFENINFI